MHQQYTAMSQKAFDTATDELLTAEKAVQWLLETKQFRTLPEKLLRFYGGTADEMKTFLRQALNQLHPDAKERESIRKNVSNWFTQQKGIDDRTISRGYALEICFILKMDVATADAFLRAVTGEGLHWRSLEEFAAGYALRQGLTEQEYRALVASLTESMGTPEDPRIPEGFTRANREVVQTLRDEAALRTYVADHRADFSEYRNTAYSYFTDLMDVLQNNGTEATVAELVAANLYRRFVQKNGKLSSLAKSIRAGWPEETQLARMRTREVPVTRKVLILLYLAAGGGQSTDAPEGFYKSLGDEADEDFDDGWDDEEGDEFTTLLTNLDAMLVECGFAPMDPRVPFDWMVLFCMATGDVFDLDGRFEAVLGDLFGNQPQPE